MLSGRFRLLYVMGSLRGHWPVGGSPAMASPLVYIVAAWS